jgi:tagatose 6-phosphate kinase
VIVVGGFNSSLDRALGLDVLRPGGVNRAASARAYPGGKGVHVALTVAALGERVALVGLIDAARRGLFEDLLGARGVEFHGVLVADAIRSCLALREADGRTTEILEPGPEADADTRAELCARFLALARDARLCVLSGSLPRGFGEGAYRELAAALPLGPRVLVDASGSLLRGCLAARPFLVKPNRDELEALSGRRIGGVDDALAAARGLSEAGARHVVASLGAEGAVAWDGARAFHAWAHVPGVKNAVGSGDCLVGGLAAGFLRGLGLEETLRLGVACGTANALSEETGFLRPADLDAVLPQVSSREVG